MILLKIIEASWQLLLESSVYILLGLIIGGLLKMFLSPAAIANHLGRGRFMPVIKAALLGVPLPLCSCGVLPAAVSLKKQGANNGAAVAFLISTPESGVDSISISWALLDPIMTIARPVAAFLSAMVAGIFENLFNPPKAERPINWLQACPVDNCCDGSDCDAETHRAHHTIFEKFGAGCLYAVTDLWADMMLWFLAGLLLAGVISALVPDSFFAGYLGGGLSSMLLMLLFGIPLYICATASTPIAAAMILKGVSPGAALVFLLVGPATNMASISVLVGLLGKRAVAIYLASISVVSVLCGLAVNKIYASLHIDVMAVAGRAAEVIPFWLQLAGAVILLGLSIKPMWQVVKRLTGKWSGHDVHSCGCGSDCQTLPMAGDGDECGCHAGHK